MKTLKLSLIAFAIAATALVSGCDTNPEENEEDKPAEYVYAKGADISWVTEIESSGHKFYNAAGKPMECTALMKELGMNAIRLRVWVNPADGWSGKADVVEKAKRASALGMRLMIDFHYSDSWADPGKQNPPSAWRDYDIAQMRQAVYDHTADVLSALKAEDIDVEWVQVGNEVNNGMLWSVGQADKNPANFAALVTEGYNAAKSVYPDAQVVLHIAGGENVPPYVYIWILDIMRNNGGKYDMIGMSLYPSKDNWRSYSENCITNIKSLYETYRKPTMICEVGMPWDAEEESYQFLSYLIRNTRSRTNGLCKGVFYWEPESPPGFNGGYSLGAFDRDGRPTKAMEAFQQ